MNFDYWNLLESCILYTYVVHKEARDEPSYRIYASVTRFEKKALVNNTSFELQLGIVCHESLVRWSLAALLHDENIMFYN